MFCAASCGRRTDLSLIYLALYADRTGLRFCDRRDGDTGRLRVLEVRVRLAITRAQISMTCLHRYIALRRARRPMRDFFRPTTDEEYRVPYQPEYSSVILPMPANLTIPPQSHPYERRVERAYREAEWLPAYDDKDMPPKYIEATSTVDYLPNRPNVYPPPPGSPPPPAPSPGEHS